jgi:hypothetical protein
MSNLEISVKTILEAVESGSFKEPEQVHSFQRAVTSILESAPVKLREAVEQGQEPISDREWRQILDEDPFLANVQALLENS